jgi:hypothetical protein
MLAALNAALRRAGVAMGCMKAGRQFMSGEGAPPRDFKPWNGLTERLLDVLGRLNAMAEGHRRHSGDVVDTLRLREISWARIAERLGVSRQTAWGQFGPRAGTRPRIRLQARFNTRKALAHRRCG